MDTYNTRSQSSELDPTSPPFPFEKPAPPSLPPPREARPITSQEATREGNYDILKDLVTKP